MAKSVAMIPILLGSQRVKDKNLLLINGKLLVDYVITSCKQAEVFDEIYINSEHGIFRSIADKYGVMFYPRDPRNGGSCCQISNKSRQCEGDRCPIQDHFVWDFISTIQSDYLFLTHTTSPLITSNTIGKFVNTMIEQNYDSMVTVIEEETEFFFDGKAVNFDPHITKSGQKMTPVQRFTAAISGWKSDAYKASYSSDSLSEIGPKYCGTYGLFPINKIEGLDIDHWEDLYLAESYLIYRDGCNRARGRTYASVNQDNNTIEY